MRAWKGSYLSSQADTSQTHSGIISHLVDARDMFENNCRTLISFLPSSVIMSVVFASLDSMSGQWPSSETC